MRWPADVDFVGDYPVANDPIPTLSFASVGPTIRLLAVKWLYSTLGRQFGLLCIVVEIVQTAVDIFATAYCLS